MTRCSGKTVKGENCRNHCTGGKTLCSSHWKKKHGETLTIRSKPKQTDSIEIPTNAVAESGDKSTETLDIFTPKPVLKKLSRKVEESKNPKSSRLRKKHAIDNINISGYTKVLKLGEGTFSNVYLAKDPNGNQVAIKIETPVKKGTSAVWKEYTILRSLAGMKGFPKVYKHGKETIGGVEYHYIVMEVVGTSLKEMRDVIGGPFEKIKIKCIAVQAIERLEELHGKGYLHRDIKDGNFTLAKDGTVYLIDLALSKPITQEGLPISSSYQVGTPRYASIAAHKNQRPSPKDDLEALGYVLANLYVQHLPWSVAVNPTMGKISNLWDAILEVKQAKKPQDYISDFPELVEYLDRVLRMKPFDTIDYGRLKALFT